MNIEIFDTIKEKVILESGEKYYKEGYIRNFDIIRITEDTLNIKGNLIIDDKNYNSEVIVNVPKNKIVDSYCTCDEHGGFCAHRAALIFRLLEDVEQIVKNGKIDDELFHHYKRELEKTKLLKTLKNLSEKYSIKIQLILEDRFSEEFRLKILFYKGDKLINFYTGITYNEKWDDQRNFNYLLFPLKDRLIIKTINEWFQYMPEDDFVIDKDKIDIFMKIISDFPEVYLEDSEEKIKFSQKYYKPHLLINLSEEGAKVKVKIDSDNFFIFSGDFYQWILIDNMIYPLKVKLSESIWKYLIEEELYLNDNEIATFYYEYIPKIQNSFEIQLEGEVRLKNQESYSYKFILDYEDEIIIKPVIKIISDEGNEIIFDDFIFATPEQLNMCKFVNKQYLIIKRNLKKEYALLFKLKKYNFIIEGNVLKQKNKLFYKKFLEEGPSFLKSEGEVEFTENFKKIMLEKIYLLVDLKFTFSNISANLLEIEEEYVYSDGAVINKKELKETIEKLVQGKRFINKNNSLTLIENYNEIKNLRILLDEISSESESALKELPIRKEFFKHYIYVTQFFYLYDKLQEIKEESEDSKINIILNDKLKKMLQLKENIINKQDISLLKRKVSIPSEVENILRNYQKFGFFWFHFLKEFHFGGILADDMGLGKTIQLLTFIKSLNSPKPSLIVCPTSLIHNWESEILKFFPKTKYLIVKGNIQERTRLLQHINRYDLIITSYSLIRNDIDKYEIYDFEVVALDEANHIKNPNTKISNTVKKLNSNYRFVLTGTPVENNLKELWSIFSFVAPQLLGSFRKFKHYYIDEYSEEKLKELKSKISPFILRRVKEDVLTELPGKIEQTLFAELSPIQQKLYQEILEETRESVLAKIRKEGLNKAKLHILTALLKLRQISNHPALINPAIGFGEDISGKMDLLKELLIESVDGGHKILVFSQFRKMLQIIQKEVEGLKYDYSYLDGSTPEPKRKVEIDKFRNTDVPIFLISLKAGGYGLNLPEADVVIIVDPWWNPMVEMQAIDRAHRIGQKKTVNVYKLISRGTIEEKIINLQNKKKKLFESIVEIENIFNTLTEEEIEEFFRT